MNGRVKKLVKKIYFEEWLQRRDMVTHDGYRSQRTVVTQTVKVAKRMES